MPLFPFGKLVDENDYSPSAGFVDRTDRTDSVKGFFQFLNSHMGTPFRAKMTAARLRFRAALVGVVTALNSNIATLNHSVVEQYETVVVPPFVSPHRTISPAFTLMENISLFLSLCVPPAP